MLIAESLTAVLPPSERARLHAAIAGWWQSQSVADARLNEIAHHLLEAGGDPAEAIGWARRAAGRALQRLAFDQAANLYARALALVPRLADGERVAIELLVSRSEALAWAGAFEAALAQCKEAAQRARAAGAADLEARAALASAFFFQHFVPHPDVVALLEGALETAARAGEDGAGVAQARLLMKLSGALYPSPTPGRAIALTARRWRSRADGRSARAARRAPGRRDRRRGQVGAGARLPGACAGDRRSGPRVRPAPRDAARAGPRGADAESRSATSRVWRIASERSREILRSGPPRERSLLCLLRAVPAYLQGRFAEAEACVEEALQLGLPDDERRNRALHAWITAYTRGNREDLQALRAFADIRVPPELALVDRGGAG